MNPLERIVMNTIINALNTAADTVRIFLLSLVDGEAAMYEVTENA